MTDFQDDELDRALSALPEPLAPARLLPRVMAAVRAEEKPWYGRAWVTWPVALQAASVVCLIALGAVLWWAVPLGLGPVAESLAPVLTIGRVLCRVVVQPLAMYLFALALAASLVCAALWTAINRLALGGASTS